MVFVVFVQKNELRIYIPDFPEHAFIYVKLIHVPILA